ncbi:MAG: AAA family ATPase [Candidatus Methanoliparum thermophilum]|uniref:Proteasome-activating nucleotidase n=1 Tax=Methanoliparum thermophilum TaxID=2491083 RepID=A0A520KT94_METT2|nr:proteasome-activating nucleotidase [Candidatus Methanoliparum sp. LAM-1]RZN64970.1 MAG: AAA family ATPase [Candidatus Methanoliparum thermophilum]BDC36147.1 proteasome-activating nucleotidase [Candidatus Methanoliparum sp. LAM-1]
MEYNTDDEFKKYLMDRINQLEDKNLKLKRLCEKLEEEKRSFENYRLQYERENRRLRNELERMHMPPLLLGTVLDILDDDRVIIKSSAGPRFMVNAPKSFDKNLTAGDNVVLNQQTSAIVDIIPMPKDPSVCGMEVINAPDVSFNDIGGLKDQIKAIKETVELPLKRPDLFNSIGINPPSGVLLYGPPGTGKTMLAKSVANSTDAVFIRVIGSELVQKYIGEGARMVRELFQLAREKAPTILFIDEIDAIASKRYDTTSGDREVQRTLMQLLAEIDGFDARGNVKILAATNRIDMLDDALLRPGRFDRLIEVPLPTLEGRIDILKIHTKNMPIAKDVDLREIARLSEGSTGADIKAITTEAGMNAIRNEKKIVSMTDFLIAVETVLRGGSHYSYKKSQFGSIYV